MQRGERGDTVPTDDAFEVANKSRFEPLLFQTSGSAGAC